MRGSSSHIWSFLLVCVLAFDAHADETAAEPQTVNAKAPTTKIDRAVDGVPDDVLPAAEWRRVDAAVDRALHWMAAQQQPGGAFPTLDRGQPGVTSLGVLAFMAHGHKPNDGEFGDRLEAATDFILSCQKANGLFALQGPEETRITPSVPNEIGEACAYNHAIASLTLSEMYGMGQPRRATQLQRAIDRALKATLEMQQWPKGIPDDRGGWRYITDDGPYDSDLSITGWQLMFLRSARNAGFDVPEQRVKDAVGYIRRTFDRGAGTFGYTLERTNSHTRGMAGAGILALAHAGYHHSVEAQGAGKWLLENGFDDYNANNGVGADRYHYSLFNACQGMYQLGSPYWERFFPRTVAALLASQQPDGSWQAESLQRDGAYGNSYTTALVLLSLGAPNQFLPVFQR
jgi:hypothetical protein